MAVSSNGEPAAKELIADEMADIGGMSDIMNKIMDWSDSWTGGRLWVKNGLRLLRKMELYIVWSFLYNSNIGNSKKGG